MQQARASRAMCARPSIVFCRSRWTLASLHRFQVKAWVLYPGPERSRRKSGWGFCLLLPTQHSPLRHCRSQPDVILSGARSAQSKDPHRRCALCLAQQGPSHFHVGTIISTYLTRFGCRLTKNHADSVTIRMTTCWIRNTSQRHWIAFPDMCLYQITTALGPPATKFLIV
jgi:hypothetical protein